MGTGRLSNSPQPPPSDKMSAVPARRRSCSVVPLLDPAAAAPPFARSGGGGSEIRPPAVFCRPAGRTADCGDQPGFGEFLVPPPPFLSGGQYSARSVDAGPRCTPSMDAPARLPAVMLHVHA